jgi:hypothetical protein
MENRIFTRSSGLLDPISLEKEKRGYPQPPEEAACWPERAVPHSAGGVSKRAQMACL